jgi:hypothetical protein
VGGLEVSREEAFEVFGALREAGFEASGVWASETEASVREEWEFEVLREVREIEVHASRLEAAYTRVGKEYEEQKVCEEGKLHLGTKNVSYPYGKSPAIQIQIQVLEVLVLNSPKTVSIYFVV